MIDIIIANIKKLIFFPEASDFIAKDSKETLSLTLSINNTICE